MGALAQRLARVEQRVDDLMERIVEKFAGVAEDIRIFAPMVREHDEMRAEMRFVRESVTQLLTAQGALERRFEEEKQERIKGQAERKAELEEAILARNAEMAKLEEDRKKELVRIEEDREKQNRELRNRLLVATLALMGVFMTAAGGVAVQLLGGGS